MTSINMAIEDPQESVRRPKSGWAGFLAEKAFDDPDPRHIEASAATVEENLDQGILSTPAKGRGSS